MFIHPAKRLKPFLNLGGHDNFLVDILFLTDATGSMSTSLANVKASFVNGYKNFLASTRWNAACGIAYYRDVVDSPSFAVLQKITTESALLQNAVDRLAPVGGGDTPEGQLYALSQVALQAKTGWRNGAARLVAWFGDEPGHDPSQGVSQDDAISALNERNVQVLAFSMAPSNHLDRTGQATAITSATSYDHTAHVMLNVVQDGVVTTIFNYIQGFVPEG